MKTYISLFSGAGVGCYSFTQENFECVATNELIKRRLDVQKYNHKCKYGSGYICGDIRQEETKNKLFKEVELWQKRGNMPDLDVIIATPPCQGMSLANHKKNNHEIIKNSLIIESIKIIKRLNPKFFVFENVPAFMKSLCIDIDGTTKTIAQAIQQDLGSAYSYAYEVINFKNYGVCSSRQRTLVIGVRNDYADEISPFELFPKRREVLSLRQIIGDLPKLTKFGEICDYDVYHQFRAYPTYMRNWIMDLKEGQSAFDNEEDIKKPHRIIKDKLVINKRKNADKYRRQYWDRVGPCVHTRNDQLASQNTIHPRDDRVFSIRELMEMMTVPKEFNWVEEDFNSLNKLSFEGKKAFLKREEMKIRQSLGEAVPTIIFKEIAKNIQNALKCNTLNNTKLKTLITQKNLIDTANLIRFIDKNPLNLSLTTLSRIAELANTDRVERAAYFTSKSLITEIIKKLPDFDKKDIFILEPSVGVGNFVPLILKKYENKNVTIDVVDVDPKSINVFKILLSKCKIPNSCHVNYIVDDFLLHTFSRRYDLAVGNPPFTKMRKANNKLLITYRQQAINKNATNICSFFLDKALSLADHVCFVFPKNLLNTPEYVVTRNYISKKSVECIIDFGEKGFPGVLVETIAVFINNKSKPRTTTVISLAKNIVCEQRQSYIFDNKLPYWIIYRNQHFDTVFQQLTFGVFDVFRDRQITNQLMNNYFEKSSIRVLRSRNIEDHTGAIVDINNYDAYISKNTVKNLSVFRYLNVDNVYLAPNMTYKPRVVKKPKGVLVNGSVAILIPKQNVIPTKRQLNFFYSNEYRYFYQIAHNYQTRSLNIDSCSVYFYGLLKK